MATVGGGPAYRPLAATGDASGGRVGRGKSREGSEAGCNWGNGVGVERGNRRAVPGRIASGTSIDLNTAARSMNSSGY